MRCITVFQGRLSDGFVLNKIDESTFSLEGDLSSFVRVSRADLQRMADLQQATLVEDPYDLGCAELSKAKGKSTVFNCAVRQDVSGQISLVPAENRLNDKLLVRFNWDYWMYDSGVLELTGELQTLCSVAEPQWHRQELLFCMSPGASIKTIVEQRREIEVSGPTLWRWSSKYETEIVKTCNNYLAFSADGKKLMHK